MNIWFFVWVVLTVFILGMFFWSAEILFKQKKAWRKLALKLGLSYTPNSLLKSPRIEGVYNGYSVLLYSEEQPSNDSSRKIFRSVMLIGFQEGFPTGAALASAGRRDFIEALKVEEVHKPEYKGWNGSVVFHTQDDETLSKFMNEKRYAALNKLMNLKDKETILIFDDKEGYYRMETFDPLTDDGVVLKMLDKFTSELEVLRPTKEDKKLYPKSKPSKSKPRKKSSPTEDTPSEEA